jgi:hypothetical protein
MSHGSARLPAFADRVPTAPLAAAGLIAGFGVAVGSGSRPLGGAVMAAFGLPCLAVWVRRDGRRTAAWLTATGLVAFAASHGLGLVIGAWPSVLLVSVATAAACWRLSDRHRPAVARGRRGSVAAESLTRR